MADAREGLAELSDAVGAYAAPSAWTKKAASGLKDWNKILDAATASTNSALPSDAQVVGAVQRVMRLVRHHGLRGGRPAGRTAQNLAAGRAGLLSHGIRFLLHGL